MVHPVSVVFAVLVIAPAVLAQEAVPRLNPGDSAAVAAALADLTDQWVDAWERGDAQAVAGLFTEDGIYAANTGELLRGRAGISEGVRGWVDARPRLLEALGLDEAVDLNLEVSTVRLRTLEELAYGLYRFTMRVEPARCTLQSGHSLTVWRRGSDGGWLIESQVVNRDPDVREDSCAKRAGAGG